VKSALTRYRVLAYATGVFLLVLTLHVVLQFARPEAGVPWWEREGVGSILPGGGTWVPMVHGYLYLAYVIVAVDLWFRTRSGTQDGVDKPVVLPVLPTVLVVLAGTVPFMSFVAERWVHARVAPLVEAEPSAA
jgi:integral membrane protein